MECWGAAHSQRMAIGHAILLLYLLITIYTAELWQELDPQRQIKRTPAFFLALDGVEFAMVFCKIFLRESPSAFFVIVVVILTRMMGFSFTFKLNNVAWLSPRSRAGRLFTSAPTSSPITDTTAFRSSRPAAMTRRTSFCRCLRKAGRGPSQQCRFMLGFFLGLFWGG
ncbi:uncharacterized protein EV422DRAFT_288250 [Fimicolochytrium jonesii]|uniref:uncharacterized protein n=1 Tax=Fimicolochytrium jonesii TaxID=1396493 RepID=UPI0022FF2756|nr:uncharacterized protein EV422DRAFT_288250 [Fimicolochytrium jonesii]KAI8816537.1 hypothetical protein EV422DRAFT_288250 [Fimicolochytrium jonesii]